MTSTTVQPKSTIAAWPPTQRPTPSNRWQRPLSREMPYHSRHTLPSDRIRRADEYRPLPRAPKQLDLQQIQPLAKRPSVIELLNAGDTDALMVLRDGEIVYQYQGLHGKVWDTHSLNSASKIVVACVVGALVGKGLIDVQQRLDAYAPELLQTGYAGVTVQQALDMRSGLKLDDPMDEFYAVGQHPAQGDREAMGVKRLMLSRVRQPDATHDYGSICTDTDAVSLACEAVTNSSMTDLISSLVWRPIGARDSADMLLDPYCVPIYNGGLNATIGDTARLGQMLLDDGRVGDTQVLPADFVRDCRTNTPELAAAYKSKFYGHDWPGVAYHNTFFLEPDSPGATINFGAFGNLIRIDPADRTVCVHLGAWETQHGPVMHWISALRDLSRAAADLEM